MPRQTRKKREVLKELDVPKGTEILYTVDSKKESVDVWKK